MNQFRTDLNNNPTAFTTDLAREAGLVEGTDYVQGDPFVVGTTVYHTARLIGNPIAITIRLIDKLGFYTVMPHQRWTYIGLPYQVWLGLSYEWKVYTIGIMYQNEGGTQMKHYFPAVGQVNVGVSDTIGLADKVNG